MAEPERVGNVVDLVARAAAAARGRHPSIPDDDLGPGVDAEVADHRRALRADAWARVIPPRYGDPTLERLRTGGVPAEVVDDLAGWGADPTRNLLLTGPVGTGKTFAAWAALRRAFATGRSVAGVGVVDLLDSLRPGEDPAGTARRYREVDLLLVDDLGAERPTDWTSERLYALVNHRWEAGLPIVATTNLDPPGLRDALGERTYSRLVDDVLAVRLSGADRRRPASPERKP